MGHVMRVFSDEFVEVTSDHALDAQTNFVGQTIVIEPTENFDELGNNPAFAFWNEPGEDIYDNT